MLNKLNGYVEDFLYHIAETWGSRKFEKGRARSAHRKRWNLLSKLGARGGAVV